MAQVPIKTSEYWPHHPFVKQAAFLSLPHTEALYGGAAGGGKSDALLMAALQYVDVPGYAAILFRRTFPDLERADGLISKSLEWLGNTDAKWNDNKHRWTFPSGARIEFAQLLHEKDALKYQGAAYHFIGFDELTQFTEKQYLYVAFSRKRRTEKQKALGIPNRVRSASNPGGPGHDWVKDRFGIWREDTDPPDSPYMCHRPEWQADRKPLERRVFIPAHVQDNQALDVEDYVTSLQELDHHTRAQLLKGDWESKPPGDLFRSEWFEIVDTIPDGCKWVRYWDLAATEPGESNPDPDWTVGLRMGKHPSGTYYVEDVHRFRERPDPRDKKAQADAERDGIGTIVWVEQEPGASGVSVVDSWIRDMPTRTVKGNRNTGSKWDRATVVSSKAEHKLIKLKRGTWNKTFIAELEAFREDEEHAHDDQVDAFSGAYIALNKTGEVTRTSYAPQHKEPVVRTGDLVLRGERYVDADK